MSKVLLMLSFSLFFIGINNTVFSQKIDSLPISVGYTNYVLLQHGVSVGTEINLSDNFKKKEKSKRFKKIVFVPQFHYYVRGLGYDTPFNRNYLLSLDIGYRTFKLEKKHYFTIYGGLGQLLQNEIISNVTNLGTGVVSEGEVQQRYYLVPSLTGDYGLRVSKVFDVYARLSIGQKISFKYTNAMTLYLGIGTKIYIKRD